MSDATKKKIAILGGGVGAMAAAWRLTCESGWQERYDITVYQMGWRLGGKGASGRRAPDWRIEEHGLHLWLGFYHNAFRMLQGAFEVLNPGSAPAPAGNTPPRITNGVFERCEDAFLPHSYVGVYQEFDGAPAPWMMDTPTDNGKPWEGNSLPTVWAYLRELSEFICRKASADENRPVYANEETSAHLGTLAWLRTRAKDVLVDVEETVESVGLTLIGTLQKTMQSLPDDPAQHDPAKHDFLKEILEKLQGWIAHEFERDTVHDLTGLRHLLMLDMAVTILRGLLADEVFHGQRFDQLDDEFRGWLAENGAMQATCSLAENPLLRGLYDFVFAFDGGDTSVPDKTADFATAPALRTIFRMCFTYDGAIFWKMRAGMGDTIFAPLYKALEQRGVRFKFFHRVKALGLSADQRTIERIEIARQVTTVADYQPLIDVGELACWPSVADYAQIKEGAALQAAVARQGLDLESLWFDWPDAESLSLQNGSDFDLIVFGISLGSVPLVCADLCAASPTWQAMVENVKTVCTMGYQVWLASKLDELGWSAPSPIMDAFYEPLDTWADMSHLLSREGWAGPAPQNISYFCGTLANQALDPRDPDIPKRAAAQVSADVQDLLANRLRFLWPDAVDPNGALKPSLIVDAFQRANIDPSERYVMSVANSTHYRIKANASGFSNLVLTGDWIDNGFNAGCVEASVMAGMEAANAVLGYDLYRDVIGSELC